MNELYQIVDSHLPHDQDFKYLKEEGLAFIQKCTGNQWTNFNASDPGVTILDQVCYALTELGYCNDFPVADILTGPDGKLKMEDQFYLPEEILTTSPLTIADYRKLIIDGVAGVENAIITAYSGNINPLNKCYQVYLFIDTSIDTDNYSEICKAVFYCLNKSRNLGELFLMPRALERKTCLLKGEIQIKNEQEQNNVLLKIQTAIGNYIFPEVQQKGYNQLIENGAGTDQIFNGPLLKNGWITDRALGSKRDQLYAFELGPVIESVPGVISASVSGFYILQPAVDPIVVISEKIDCKQNELLFLDILKSRIDQRLTVICNEIPLTFQPDRILNSSLGKLPETEPKIVYGAKENIHAELPKGNFRDISTYYSIQNTFPEIFALGDSAIPANAPPVQVALLRQLKGYLTLFDQVLANQFAQLANTASLFSFKTSMTGTPTDLESFNATKTAFQRKHQEYPVPYKVFSPTYYYQSLYDIPGIRPLLKNNDVFNYSYGPVSENKPEEKSWTLYKQDPYNAYIYGLMELMEDESLNIGRRNQMLDHLLARHGESPAVTDAITDGFRYTGNNIKDKVIFKSLYLQNLGLLSYYRQKAYDCLGADKIWNELIEINPGRIHGIPGEDMVDFIFSSGKIDRLENLAERDFINYSATELKLSLLFGLKYRYRDFVRDTVNQISIVEKVKNGVKPVFDLERVTGLRETASGLLISHQVYDIPKDIKLLIEKVVVEGLLNDLLKQLESQIEPKISIALWFIKQRRGLILIETALLRKDFDFNLIIKRTGETNSFWIIEKKVSDPKESLTSTLTYENAVLVNEVLSKMDEVDLHDHAMNGTFFPAGENEYRFKEELFLSFTGNYQPLNKTNYSAAVIIKADNVFENEKFGDLFNSDLVMIFPDFVDTLNTPGLMDRLDLFMRNTLPVTIDYSSGEDLKFVEVQNLKKLIPAFVNWHNALRHHPEGIVEFKPAVTITEKSYRRFCAYELLNVLIEILAAEK